LPDEIPAVRVRTDREVVGVLQGDLAKAVVVGGDGDGDGDLPCGRATLARCRTDRPCAARPGREQVAPPGDREPQLSVSN
jgi:hypothetical protein